MVFASHSLTFHDKKEITQWLLTTLQPNIDMQQTRVKKIYLKFWRQTPAIFLS